MFVDACLPSDPAGSMRERLETLQRFGFAAVCWDTEITGRFDSRHRCSSRRVNVAHTSRGGDVAASSAARSSAAASSAASSSPSPPIRELTRLTLHLEEESNAWALHGAADALNSYDVVAIVPQSEGALERCLQSPLVEMIDLIAIPGHERPPFTLRRAICRKAVKVNVSHLFSQMPPAPC